MKLIKSSFEILDDINPIKIYKKIEAIGRVCYKSEEKITENSYKNFIANLIKRGHESVLEHVSISVRFICDRGCCYSKDTKVLTENGFKYFYDIKEGERIYTLNDNNEMILSNYNRIIQQEYNGELLNFKTTQIDLNVTPNHNMWVYDYHKRSNKERVWKFLKAQDLKNKRYKFFKSCNGFAGEQKNTIILEGLKINKGFYQKEYPNLYFNSELFLKLLGVWVTDGSISFGKKGSGNRIIISQIKEDVRVQIKDLLSNLKIDYYEDKNEFRLKCPQLFSFLLKQFIQGDNVKKTYYLSIPSWIKNLDKKLLQSFVDGCLLGDGHISKDGREMIYTASLKFAEDLVDIYLKLGKSANINTSKRYKKRTDGRNIIAKVPQYIVNVVNTYEHLYNKNDKTFVKEKYNDFVYCVELPEYHKLYVMRNGKACWSGNSHELVRHRLASYSQESTRYCNYNGKDMEFIIPCWSLNLESGMIFDSINASIQYQSLIKEEQIFVSNCIHNEIYYNQLIKSMFTPQKARAVLPNSLKTEIIMTANIREWRHILQLRCSLNAHPDMRNLMMPLREKFQKDLGLLFL